MLEGTKGTRTWGGRGAGREGIPGRRNAISRGVSMEPWPRDVAGVGFTRGAGNGRGRPNGQGGARRRRPAGPGRGGMQQAKRKRSGRISQEGGRVP